MKLANQFILTLILIVSVLLAGCGQSPNTASAPEKSPLAADAASLITADCIVSYFRQGQSPYITQQQYSFNTDTGTLKVSANEPSGSYTFTLKKDQFTQSGPLSGFLSELPARFVSRDLALAVYYSFSAGADLIETDALETADNQKLEGRLYQPIKTPWPSDQTRVILLKDLGTGRIDTVGLAQYDVTAPAEINMEASLPVTTRWLIKSYNLRYSKDLDRLLPRKIDLFDIQNGIASKKLMVQIELKDIQYKQRPVATEQ